MALKLVTYYIIYSFWFLHVTGTQNKPPDIAFLLDGSSYAGELSFKRERTFAASLSRRVARKEKNLRIDVATYGDWAHLYLLLGYTATWSKISTHKKTSSFQFRQIGELIVRWALPCGTSSRPPEGTILASPRVLWLWLSHRRDNHRMLSSKGSKNFVQRSVGGACGCML